MRYLPRPPRHVRTLLWVALAALLLSSCTGTKTELPPPLLIVGVSAGGGPQLALIEDLGVEAARGERFALVEGSLRSLSAPAVALDFVDREGERATVWVLTREVTAEGVRAYLEPFTAAGIDPSEPTAFARSSAQALTLVTPAGDGVLDQPLARSLSCPSAMQVSRTGTWFLVLDVPAECDASTAEYPVVWLVERAQGVATPLQQGNEVLPLEPYTDQREEPERGYFLVAGPNGAQVYATTEGERSSAWFGGRLLEASPSTLKTAAGSGRELLVVADAALTGVHLAGSEEPLGSSTTVTTPRRLVADPLGYAEHALVLGASEVGVHLLGDALGEVEVKKVPFPRAAAGTVDPLLYYGYAVREGALLTIDLLTASSEDERLSSLVQQVEGLVLPQGPAGDALSVLGWVRAAERSGP